MELGHERYDVTPKFARPELLNFVSYHVSALRDGQPQGSGILLLAWQITSLNRETYLRILVLSLFAERQVILVMIPRSLK